MTDTDLYHVRAVVNGETIDVDVEGRVLASDFLRHDLGLTGTHVGCEQGVCGACTILVDGAAVRSCLLFAAQLDGALVTTVEGLDDGLAGDLRRAFHENHALQCGFCTPGFLTSLHSRLAEIPAADDADIRALLSGNVCRCTGYQNIVAAVREVSARRAPRNP